MSEEPNSSFHLVQPRRDGLPPKSASARPSLRATLILSRLRPARLRGKRAAMPIWIFVAVLGLVLGGMQLALHPGPGTAGRYGSAGRGTLDPPPGLSRDERARFWAYAAYDPARLRERFMVPAGAARDPALARARLQALLAGGIGPEARAEILELERTSPVWHPPPPPLPEPQPLPSRSQ